MDFYTRIATPTTDIARPVNTYSPRDISNCFHGRIMRGSLSEILGLGNAFHSFLRLHYIDYRMGEDLRKPSRQFVP
jgi:hypothetical protein